MPRTIKAAVSPGKGAPPVIETLLLDDPDKDELVIAIGAAGICHTDLGIADWAEDPRVYGHEGAGTVVEVGSGVTGFAPGDRVVATFGFCGNCPTCNGGRPAYCVDHIALNALGQRANGRPSLMRECGTAIGGAFFQQSCFATHALVTQRNVVKLPDSMDFVTAAPLGCGIQTGAGAVINQLPAGEGDPIVVIGCGAVGLAAVMGARILGCEPIIAIELDPSRRALAAELGATHVLDGGASDMVEQVLKISSGATAVLDSAGRQDTFEAGLAMLRPGGALGVLTLPGGFDEPIPHPGGATFMTTSIIGIVEGDSVPDTFLPQLMRWHADGQLPHDRMIETFAFEDIGQALTAARSQSVVKPVLTFAQEPLS